jgi:hypothetical protein
MKDPRILFHDTKPDEEGKRFFTLMWEVAPRLVGLPSKGLKLSNQRAQVFRSVQWQAFLADGAREVTK